MLNVYEYYDLCMQGFASLKREIKEAEQYTMQLYNNQIQADEQVAAARQAQQENQNVQFNSEPEIQHEEPVKTKNVEQKVKEKK